MMCDQVKQNPLEDVLREQIKASSGITFAEFMEQCLYHPDYGYYLVSRDRIGKGGDFFTSSSVHSLFGRLMSRQLAEMAEILGDENFQIVEQGAGEGYLALDILDALLDEDPDLYGRLSYVLIEVSPDNRGRQEKKLTRHLDKISWCSEGDWSLTSGCFLSNELVDAFPVHVVEKKSGRLQEVFVTNGGDAFAEELRSPSETSLQDHLDWLGVAPVDGNRAEINLHAPEWMKHVAGKIRKGFVVTVDYGYPAEEIYAPHRRDGTLMCYHRHQADDDPYTLVGEKDITTHVDFTALQKAGGEAGLKTLWFGEQYRFLLGLGFFEELVKLEASVEDEQEARALRLTLKNLIMPEAGMGETFKVLVQGRNVDAPELRCARPIADIHSPA